MNNRELKEKTHWGKKYWKVSSFSILAENKHLHSTKIVRHSDHKSSKNLKMFKNHCSSIIILNQNFNKSVVLKTAMSQKLTCNFSLKLSWTVNFILGYSRFSQNVYLTAWCHLHVESKKQYKRMYLQTVKSQM